MLVRTEAIITQLVFDHALRIRMKAETSESPAASRVTTAAQTPDNASIAEAEEQPATHDNNSSEDGTVRASTISASSTAATQSGSDAPKKAEETKATPAPAEPAAKSGNLVGKINNLVTTDLNNLVDGRDFLFLGPFHSLRQIEDHADIRPCSVVCATASHLVCLVPVLDSRVEVCAHWRICGPILTVVLSAFMGMIAMAVLFPVPGYVASMIQGVQTEKMKKVTASALGF